MLSEIKNARQVPFEGFRRWFTDSDMDFIVWYEDESLTTINGFQLSYDKASQEHALTWTVSAGFQLSRIDPGETVLGAKMSPVLIPATDFDYAKVLETFLSAAAAIEYGLVCLVRDHIQEYAKLHPNAAEPDPHHHILAQVLLENLRDCFYGPGFHGPELFPTLKQFNASQALQAQPNSESHSEEPLSVWQIALHCAYWKHSTSRKLSAYLGLPNIEPDIELADWVAQPQGASEAEWQACLATLQREHENLVQVVGEFLNRRPQALSNIEAKSGLPWAKLIYGMANHDAYHSAHVRNLGILALS